MKCALCGNTIDKLHPFTNPKSHKKDCKIYASDNEVVRVIKGK